MSKSRNDHHKNDRPEYDDPDYDFFTEKQKQREKYMIRQKQRWSKHPNIEDLDNDNHQRHIQ